MRIGENNIMTVRSFMMLHLKNGNKRFPIGRIQVEKGLPLLLDVIGMRTKSSFNECVNKVLKCYKYGKTDHHAPDCKEDGPTCFNCGE